MNNCTAAADFRTGAGVCPPGRSAKIAGFHGGAVARPAFTFHTPDDDHESR